MLPAVPVPAAPLVVAPVPEPALPVFAAFISRPAVALVVRFMSVELLPDAIVDPPLLFMPDWPPMLPLAPPQALCIDDALHPDATRMPDNALPLRPVLPLVVWPDCEPLVVWPD